MTYLWPLFQLFHLVSHCISRPGGSYVCFRRAVICSPLFFRPVPSTNFSSSVFSSWSSWLPSSPTGRLCSRTFQPIIYVPTLVETWKAWSFQTLLFTKKTDDRLISIVGGVNGVMNCLSRYEFRMTYVLFWPIVIIIIHLPWQTLRRSLTWLATIPPSDGGHLNSPGGRCSFC